MKLMQLEVEKPEEAHIPWNEHPICLVAIDCNGEAHLLQILNSGKCREDYQLEDLQEEIDGSIFSDAQDVGVYTVEARFMYSTDYWGDSDRFCEFGQFIPYQECSKCQQPLRKDKEGECMSCKEISVLKSGHLDGN